MNEHVRRNRAHWDRIARDYQRTHRDHFRADQLHWGAWGLPEAELALLGPVAGLDVLELGCGGGHSSAAVAAAGARVTAVDVSPAQLALAREVVGGRVRLVEADAEALPFDDASFDLAFADHGAPTFCDPERLLPEVARVLRPGGRLVFNMTTPLLDACWDGRRIGEALVTPWFALGAMPGEDGEVSYQLGYGAWIAAFGRAGFVVERLVELRPPPGARPRFENFASPAWARRWPAEHAWCARVLTRPG